MDLVVELFPLSWHLTASGICLALAVWVGRSAPWRTLVQDGPRLNILMGCAVLLMALWSLRAGVQPGLNLHVLGAMVATLILGPQLALVALAVTLTAVTLNGALPWGAWPINFAVMVAWPVLLAWALHRWVARHLPKNFFVFVFITGFLGGALTVLASGALATLCLALAGAYDLTSLTEGYLPFFLLLGFSEAWLSGGAITLLVIYRPGWVSTFSDEVYFTKP